MGSRIKQLRKVLKLTQKEFADQIGMSQSSIAMLEMDKRQLNAKTTRLICNVYSVNESWLTSGHGEMFCADRVENDLMNIIQMLNSEMQQSLMSIAKQLLFVQTNNIVEAEHIDRYHIYKSQELPASAARDESEALIRPAMIDTYI